VKAVVAGDKGDEIRDVPKPEPGANEVVFRAHASMPMLSRSPCWRSYRLARTTAANGRGRSSKKEITKKNSVAVRSNGRPGFAAALGQASRARENPQKRRLTRHRWLRSYKPR
jgi:hypothetical protein